MSHEIALKLIKTKDLEIAKLMAEIDALERRVEELEELLEEFNFLAERPKPRNTKTDVELWNEWCDYGH